MNRKKRNGIIAAVLILALGIVLGVVYFRAPAEGDGTEKTITVEITHLDGSVNSYDITTTEAYLRGALEQEGLVSGPTMQYGLWIQTMDGETADESLEQWWGYTKAGEYVETGVDATKIADGDVFEFTLNVGY